MSLNIEPNFSKLVGDYTSDFVGRAWLTEKLMRLLDDPRSRIIVLTGPAGVGKTAFLAQLAELHPDWPRYFIRRDSREILSPGDAKTFLLAIGAQMAAFRPKLFRPENLEVIVRQRLGTALHGSEVVGLHVKELRASPFYRIAIQVEQQVEQAGGMITGVKVDRFFADVRQYSMQDLQYLGIVYPLHLLARLEPECRVVILVDALDELRYSSTGSIPDVTRALRELPDFEALSNVRFVVSSRGGTEDVDHLLALPGANYLPIDTSSDENKIDLQQYTAATVRRLYEIGAFEGLQVREQDFSTTLVAKAKGNFLYLKTFLSALLHATADPERHDRLERLVELEGVPEGLSELYGYFLSNVEKWAKTEFPRQTWRSFLAPLLGTLAVARHPLTSEQLSAFSGLEMDSLVLLLREIMQFVDPSLDDGPSGGRKLYRIYHASFAEYIVDRRLNRRRWVDGSKAHERIASYYWTKYRNNWLYCDKYGLDQMVFHLTRSGDLERLFMLIVDEEWVRVRSEQSSYPHDALVSDFEMAWRAAENADRAFVKEGKLAPYLGVEIRCVLSIASVNGQLLDIGYSAILDRIMEGTLTLSQAITIIKSVPNSAFRFQLLLKIASETSNYLRIANSLRGQVFVDAFGAARQIADGQNRLEALIEVLPALPENTLPSAIFEAISAVKQLKDRHRKSQVLHPGEPPWSQAADRGDGLERLAKKLATMAPEWSLSSVRSWVKATCEIEDDLGCAQTIRETASRFIRLNSGAQVTVIPTETDSLAFGPNLPKAREPLGQLRNQDQGKIVEVLVSLVPHVSDWLLESVLRGCQPASAAAQGRRLYEALSSRIGAVLGNQANAVRDVEEFDQRAEVLAALAPRLPGEFWPGALGIVCEGGNTRERARALARVAPHLPKMIMNDALKLIDGIEEHEQSEALTALAFRLPEELWPHALRMVGAGGSSYVRARALALIAPHLPTALMSEALKLARGIEEEKRAEALAALAPRLLEVLWPEALRIVQEGGNSRVRACALARLAPHIPKTLMNDALMLVRGIAVFDQRAEALAALAPRLPEDLWPGALQIVRKGGSSGARARALARVAPDLPKAMMYDALTLVGGIEEDEQSKALAALAPRLPEELWPEVLRIIHSGGSSRARACALTRVAPHLPRVLTNDALTLIGGIEEEWRSEALAALAPRLPEELWPETLRMVGEAGSRHARARGLILVARYLPRALMDDALKLVRGIEDEGAVHSYPGAESLTRRHGRGRVFLPFLAALQRPIPQELTDEIAEILLDFSSSDPDYWSKGDFRAFAELTHHVPRPQQIAALDWVFNISRFAQDRGRGYWHWTANLRSLRLIEIIPYLYEPVQSEAVEEALRFMRDSSVAHGHGGKQMMAEIAPFISVKFVQRAFDVGNELGILDVLANSIPKSVCNEAFSLGKMRRNTCLITAIAERLPEEFAMDALRLTREIGDAEAHAQMLKLFVKSSLHLSPVDLHVAWGEMLNDLVRLSRRELLDDLQESVPMMMALGGNDALDEFFGAISDVGRWWP